MTRLLKPPSRLHFLEFRTLSIRAPYEYELVRVGVDLFTEILLVIISNIIMKFISLLGFTALVATVSARSVKTTTAKVLADTNYQVRLG